MQVVNKSSYISTIYSAIVINSDTSQDPENKNRVQIYIPSVNFDYADHWEEYMNMKDKKSSEYSNAFPWAITLKENLNNGDNVYGSYIDGDGHQYIILGLDVNNQPINTAGVGGSVDTRNYTDLALSIILHNEIGVSITDWENKSISSSKYSTITLHDGGEKDKNTGQWIKQGCWAIGLIQWNGVRAYDTLYAIAEDDNNWETYFMNNTDLKTSLKASLSSRNTIGQRSKFSKEKGYNPEKGGATYNAIKSMLSTDISKSVQNNIAYNDIFSIINMLMDEGCTNPAILIYMADFYNQYGAGHSTTTSKCVEACSKSGNMIEQLDWLITNQLKPNFNFDKYSSRRKTTYDYIVELYNNGKFNTTSLTDTDGGNNGPMIAGTGEYCMPFVGSYIITAQWGKAGYSGGYTGYSNGTGHSGIDFGCPSGTTLLACTNGIVEKTANLTNSYGTHIKIRADDGNLIIYAHMSSYIVNKDDRVIKGQIIGYSGNTGHSTGEHLHFEIRPKSNGDFSENMYGSTNPAPYLGIKGHTHDRVSGA